MGLKRIPHADDLYRFRLISDPRISPDGERVAFVLKQMNKEEDDYASNIYVGTKSGGCRQFTSGNKDSAPRWSPDGKHLAFLSKRGDAPQIHIMPADGGESVALTDRKLGAGAPCWSPDGEGITFSAVVSLDPEDENEDEQEEKKTARTKIVERSSYKEDGEGYLGNRRSHIFVVRLLDRRLQQLTDGDFFDRDPDWSPDGKFIAFASKRQPDWDYTPTSDIYVHDLQSGGDRQVTKGNGFGFPKWRPDGSTIACVGHADPRDLFLPARIYEVSPSTGEFRDLLGDWDWAVGNEILSDIAMSDGDERLTWLGNYLYFLGSQRGEGNVYRIDTGRPAGVEAVTKGVHNVTGYSISHDGTIAASIASSTHPAEIFIQERGRELVQITRENNSLLEEIGIRRPERMAFSAPDGETSEGWLLKPDGEGPHPLLLYIHGGPTSAAGETFFFEYQFLAGEGYAVFFPNIRGSGTYGRGYQESIFQRWGTKDYEDVMAAARMLEQLPWVDSNRIGIAGGSYGGYMTFWAMSHNNFFRAGITERCLCNWISFLGTSDSGWAWEPVTGAFPEDDVNKLWDKSPLKYVANVQAPLMVIHYEEDDRTALEQGEQAFNALRRLGKTTKFVVFPDESHGMTRQGKPSRRVERMGIILEWLNQHLRGR